MNDKYTDSDIHITGKFAEKLDNFWFYHKWHILIGLFVTFVLTVCIVQSCTKTEYDVNVLYSGPYAFSSGEIDSAIEDLNAVMPKDFSGDGEKNTGYIYYQVMNADQLEALQKESEGKLNTSYFTSQKDMYTKALWTGNYAILLIDESLYKELEYLTIEAVKKDKSAVGRLRKLSDVFVTVPESAFSDYGIRFSETALYKNSKQLSKLPKDTVLCLLSPYVFGASSDKNVYAQITEMFVAMAKD